MASLPIEPWRTRWSRRAKTIPALFAIAAVCWATAPLTLAGAGLTDLVRRDLRFPRVRAIALVLAYLWADIIAVFLALGSWLLQAGDPDRVNAQAYRIQDFLTGFLFKSICVTQSLRVDVETPDPLDPPFLLLVRHTSALDTMIAAAVLAIPHQMRLRYVLKRELLNDPGFDLIGSRLDCAFVDRSGAKRDREVEAVARLTDGLGPRDTILVYPEGTHFTPAKLARAQAKLANGPYAEDAAAFQHVLPPRLGGVLALLGRAPHLDVVVLEHTGLEPSVSASRVWRGDLVGARLHVRLRRVSAAEIPPDDRERWLFRTWREVDRWVGASLAQNAR